MRFILPLALLSATPAFAAPGSFFSLENTDFIVVLGFLVFIAILLYFKIPSMLTGMLDDRSKGIRNDLDEARALRDEAQALLASYERKTRDARDQADQILATAKAEATAAGDQAKIDLQTSVARRMAAAWTVPLRQMPARHHFDVIDDLRNPDSALMADLLA